MKKVTFLLVFISMFGYAQTTTLPPIQDRLPQEFMDRMNPNALTSKVDAFLDMNQIGNVNNVQSQSFQREMLVQNRNYNLRLDSESYINFGSNSIDSKREHTYDANGNNTLDIYYGWNTDTETFVPSSKREWSRDASGYRTLYIDYQWNTETETFVPTSKGEYTFDADGNITLYIIYQWNTETETFVPLAKAEYTFDANGNRPLYIDYQWNTETETFVLYQKIEHIFDANGNITLSMYYTWNTETETFVPNSKREYTFDANGNDTLDIYYGWNTDTETFVPSSKSEYTFDADGNITLYIFYQWNTDTETFVPSSKMEFTHDANGNLTLRISYIWNTEIQSLVPSSKREWSRDANGNITLRILYIWNTEIQSLVPSYKTEYTYTNNFKTNETSYNWYAGLGVFKPGFKMDISPQSETDTNLVREGILYEYDTNFNTWNELEGDELKSYWHYTKVSTLSADKLETSTFAIYPNPTDNTLFISGNESAIAVVIYNLLGKEVLSVKNTNNINVQALPSGVYTIRISDGVRQTNRKFIKN